MDEVIKVLKASYDMIIIDNPPVGLVTDAIPIIQKADYPLYVFRANYSRKTSYKFLIDCKTKMESTNYL